MQDQPSLHDHDGEVEVPLKKRIYGWLLMALVILSVLFLFIMVLYDATSMFCGFGDWLMHSCPQRFNPDAS